MRAPSSFLGEAVEGAGWRALCLPQLGHGCARPSPRTVTILELCEAGNQEESAETLEGSEKAGLSEEQAGL